MNPNYDVLDDEGLIRWRFKPTIIEAPQSVLLAHARQAFENAKRHFEQSRAFSALEMTVSERFWMEHIPLTNHVCFGTGSVTTGSDKSICMAQLAVFVVIVELLQRHQPGNARPPMYAQDPKYNSLDKALLASLHIKYVEHPEGFRLVDPQTFAYSAVPPSFVARGIMVRDPAIYMIDNTLQLWRNPDQAEKRAQFFTYFPEDFPNEKLTEEQQKARMEQDEIKAGAIVDKFLTDKEKFHMPQYLPAFNNPVEPGSREISPLYMFWAEPSEGGMSAMMRQMALRGSAAQLV